MSTKTSEKYWKDRSEQLLLDVLEDGEKVHRKLKSAYSKAQRDIENGIRLLLFRFQTQTGLDSKAAYELLKGEEFKQWRMDIGEYLAQIEATGDEKLLLELNTLAMRSRINRLEALQGQIKANMAVLANEETKQVGEHLAKAYENTFYQNMYSHYKHNTERFIRAAQKSAIRLDLEAIKKLMLEDWKGSNYSKRIWKRQYEVAKLISDAVARNITRGQSLDNNVKQMMDSIKKMGLDPKLRSDYEFNCKRLIMTETAYMKAKADIDTYKRMGIEEYKFLATLDNKTSDECQSLDNKIYKVEDAQPGTNYPPLHPQCRSTTIAIGEYTRKDGTRAARNEDGSVYYVDKNLDYKAWKEKYVDGAGDEPEKKEGETAPKQEEPKADVKPEEPKTEAKNEEPKKKLKYTQEEVDRATEYYVSGDGMWINTYLRGPKAWEENYGISEDELNQIEALKQGTDSEEVKEKVLYRSADARSVFGDISESDYYNLKSKIVYNSEGKVYDDVFEKYVGGVKDKEIVEKGFMSTSKNQDVALEWGDFSGSDMPIVLELDASKGIRGRDLKDFEIKGGEQYEVLLSPDQKYKVNSVGHKNGQIYVKADLISGKAIVKNKKLRYNDSIEEIADSILDKCKEIEPAITEKLKEISKQTGAELAGLEYRIKGRESLIRKIKADMVEKNIDALTAGAQINDTLRYTLVQNDEKFASSYSMTKKELLKEGYEIFRVKNTFKDGAHYKGVNTLVRDKEENVFELQFHTPISFKIKQDPLHEMYEEYRKLDSTSKRAQELLTKMIEESSKIQNPDDVKKIK